MVKDKIQATPPYKRILLKLSGEALMGAQHFGIEKEACSTLASTIKEIVDMGVQIGIVLGGGNIFRGLHGSESLGIKRAQADYIGMLATLMNGLIFQQTLSNAGIDSRVMSGYKGFDIVEPAIWSMAVKHLDKQRVVIFVGGTGNPFFTTDTAAALRASEIDAQLLIKATKVDGVYDKDPLQYPNAKKYDTLNYTQVLEQNLKVMDATAISLCRDNDIPIMVLNMTSKTALVDAIHHKNTGTLVRGE